MKIFFLILSILGVAPLSAATIFNVNYTSSGGPFVSGPGGTLPAPPGLPLVSTLTANDPNEIRAAGFTTWINQYNSGDYFTFTVSALVPQDRVALTGFWFGVNSTPSGPTSFRVELWSGGTFLSGASASHLPGTYDEPIYLVSDSSVAEIRIVGLGGIGDSGPGNHESFGISTSSFGFAVVPEPSVVVMAFVGLISVLGFRRRNGGGCP